MTKKYLFNVIAIYWGRYDHYRVMANQKMAQKWFSCRKKEFSAGYKIKYQFLNWRNIRDTTLLG